MKQTRIPSVHTCQVLSTRILCNIKTTTFQSRIFYLAYNRSMLKSFLCHGQAIVFSNKGPIIFVTNQAV